MSLSTARITIVGAGSMAEAIIRGLTADENSNKQRITVCNRSDVARLQLLQHQYGVSFAVDAEQKAATIAAADIVVVAFKPKDAVEGFQSIKSLMKPSQLLVSVIAGLSMTTMGLLLGTKEQPIARAMPNTSSAIGLGATGISFSGSVKPEQQQTIIEMFAATSIVTIVEEARLDIVTGVSGSGPAYIYYMMEAMIEGGIRGGLTPEAAKELTIQTVIGAAHMVERTGEPPAELRRKVTSPGGTTQAAIEMLDHHQFAIGVTKAVLRACERANEMGKTISAQVSEIKF